MHEYREDDLKRAIEKRIGMLGDIDPPADSRERTLDAMATAAEAKVDDGASRWSFAAAASFLLALGMIATIVTVVVIDDLTLRDARVAPEVVFEPDLEYLALLQESMRLELLLSQLPAQRRVMRVGTAETIAALETQIELIDEQLTIGSVAGLEPETRETLWRDRVDVMNALVQVRYAQSNLFEF